MGLEHGILEEKIMQIDQEFKNLIPPLQPEEFAGLEASILAEGCRDSLVTWNGILIDGHNRYEICSKHSLEYDTIEKQFDGRLQVKLWIRSNQLARRNLTDAWKIELALGSKADLAEIGRAKLAEAGAKHAGNQYAKMEPLSINDKPSNEPKHDTRQTIADTLGMSTGKLAQAEYVRAKAPEVWEQAKAGELSIGGAYKEIKKEENLEIKKNRVINETRESIKLPAIIIESDCMSVLDNIDDIDLLIADPPY